MLTSSSNSATQLTSTAEPSRFSTASQFNTSSSRILFSAYSQSSNFSAPFPNPFPVPETDLFLIFGPKTPVAPHLRRLIPQSLLGFFEHAFILVTEHGIPMPFPDSTNAQGSLEISVESEKNPDGTNILLSSTVADATIGIIYYMLHEGFSTTKITLVRPSTTGKRIRAGTIDIRKRPGVELVGGGRNASDADIASS